MNEHAPQPPKKQIWVRLLDDEEIKQREENLQLNEQERALFAAVREKLARVRHDMSRALPAPPPGSHYLPSHEELDPRLEAEAAVEKIEERIDVGRAGPKFTRIRKRTIPIRRVKRGHPDFERVWAEEKAEAERAAAEQEPADKSKPGPKPLLDETLQEQLCMRLSVGLSRSIAAVQLGISRSTITRTMKLNPDFKRRVLLAEVTFQSNRTLLMLQASRESWRAGAWMFKHYHPHRSVRRMLREDDARMTAEAMEQMSQQLDERQAG